MDRLIITRDPNSRGHVSVSVEGRSDIHVSGPLKDQCQMVFYALDGIVRELDRTKPHKETPDADSRTH